MNEQESTDHTDQSDDVEAHRFRPGKADAEGAEGADDVEAHRFRPGKADAEGAEGADDVEAHVYVQEPKDLKN